jgi:hypothetical protein
VLLIMQDHFRIFIYVLFMHSLSRCINFMYEGGMALYGCETWSQTLKEEQRLRVF